MSYNIPHLAAFTRYHTVMRCCAIIIQYFPVGIIAQVPKL